MILLSFFIKCDAKEVAFSIWFYSVVMTYLLGIVCLFIYSDLIKKNLGLYLRLVMNIFMYSYFFYVQFLGIVKNYFNEETITSFVLFVPFVVYKYRDYFEPTPVQKMMSRMFLLVFKTQLLAIISAPFCLMLDEIPRFSFYVIYTLFFFPFIKTLKFLKQKKEEVK